MHTILATFIKINSLSIYVTHCYKFRAQQLDQYRHIEAWTIAEDILSSILNKIVSYEDMPNDENNALSSDAVGNHEENILEPAMEEELTPLSDNARDEDKTIRLNILQKLLELACAMVTLDPLHVVLFLLLVLVDKKW